MQAKISFSDPSSTGLIVKLVVQDSGHGHKVPKSFTGKKFETSFLADHNTLLVGLGKEQEIKDDYYRRCGARATKAASALKFDSVHFAADGLTEQSCNLLLEGALMANYAFDKYRSKEEKFQRIGSFSFPKSMSSCRDQMEKILKVSQSIYLVRDLVTDNSDYVTPRHLEDVAKKIAKQHRLKIRVLQEAQLKKLGLNLFASVGRAGNTPPRLILLEYNGNARPGEKILLIGKGITFDSGGLNIKVGESIKDMRMDMAGAATMLAIMNAAAQLGLKKNLVAALACAENLVDSRSYRPGDVIKSYGGLTVENLNTDAEGRLVLADTIAFAAKKYNPKVILEYSTLTGAVLGALGSHCAGVVSNSPEYSKKLFEAGMETHELVWELPLFEEYLDETKGERADLRSIGKTRSNGTIFGGAFLSKFAGATPFVHVDIAGTAMLDEAKDYMPKDGSGFGVRLGIAFLEKI
ncbi:MAG: leucyl aminopeptidase family protein [archaeon]|nr:leucyl aminopeptidase family protein [archaeon]